MKPEMTYINRYDESGVFIFMCRVMESRTPGNCMHLIIN